MDFFDEITKLKKDFPHGNEITNEFSRYTLNFYQSFSIGLFVFLFFLGIFFGNLFATCQASSYFYSNDCLVTEFNFSVMLFVWFIGLLISVFIFSIGHIIALLREINEKLSKFKS